MGLVQDVVRSACHLLFFHVLPHLLLVVGVLLMMPLLLEFVSLGVIAAIASATVVGLVLLGRRI